MCFLGGEVINNDWPSILPEHYTIHTETAGLKQLIGVASKIGTLPAPVKCCGVVHEATIEEKDWASRSSSNPDPTTPPGKAKFR